jgi:hypothetical protein
VDACLQRVCVLLLWAGVAARPCVLHPFRIISVRFKNSTRQTSGVIPSLHIAYIKLVGRMLCKPDESLHSHQLVFLFLT